MRSDTDMQNRLEILIFVVIFATMKLTARKQPNAHPYELEAAKRKITLVGFLSSTLMHTHFLPLYGRNVSCQHSGLTGG